jgi:hypothetical protein
MPNVIFAYNTTDSIPAAGAQRKTYNVVFANDRGFTLAGERDELLDYSDPQDVAGSKLKLFVKLGAGVLKLQADRDWFTTFFKAKHKWAVYGDFKDTANSGNDNLCKCVPVDDEIEISIPYDQRNGYELVSQKVF